MSEYQDDFPRRAAGPAPQDAGRSGALSIGQFLSAYWRARTFVIAVLGIFFVGAILYLSFVAQPVYRAKAVIGPPASSAPSLGGGPSAALAVYAGIDLGGDSTTFMKYLQVIHSTRLADVLDKKYGLMKDNFGGWNEQTHQWIPPSGPLPTLVRAIRGLIGMPAWAPPTASTFAEALAQKLNVTKIPGASLIDIKTQLYTVSLDGADRLQTVRLLNLILTEADGIVRRDRLGNAARRMNYLKQAAGQSPELFLRDSLQAVAMEQQRSLMMLNADGLYAVDLIDPPNADATPVAPRGRVVLLVAFMMGFVVTLLGIYLLLRLHTQRAVANGLDPRTVPFQDPVGSVIASMRRRLGRLRGASA
ncbi:MAG TPA: Wzz/FepE/Etk N-terminal domain-containing protein [Rhizomicrobium sp.]